MEKIKNLDELKQLAVGEKFYVVKGGNNVCYFFAGNHPKEKSLVIAVPTYCYMDAVVFGERLFNDKSAVLKGQYVSEEIGVEMIAQYRDKIQAIEEIYLKQVIKP